MQNEANIVIGSCLKEMRSKQGLTQEQIANEFGVPQSFISKLESGSRGLRFYELFPYATALGMNPDVLFHEINRSLAQYLRNKRESNSQ